MGTFINISNHSSKSWSKEQLREARLFGEVIDLPFPDIDPLWDDEKTDALVQKYFEAVTAYEAPTAMVQGEFVFSYRLVSRLKEANIKTVAACSKRQSVETADENGITTKTSQFVFEGFKEY